MSDSLARLGWQDFEHLLAEYYRGQGYRVERGSDLDLRLHRRSESIIVRCKLWDATEVPAAEVTELMGTMLNEAATSGVLVTRGAYSREAQGVARRQPRLQLVDGDALRVMLKLPDHLDTAPLAEKVARQAAPARRRASTQAVAGSRTLPFVVGAFVLILLALFGWKVMSDRKPPVAPAAPEPVPAPVARGASAPPASLPPLSGASGIVSRPGRPYGDPPVASRELAERERLRKLDDDARRTRSQHDDAIKVMERNTPQVGNTD